MPPLAAPYTRIVPVWMEAALDRLSLFALHSVRGMGSATLRRMIERFGSPEAALAQASHSTLRRFPRLGPDAIAEILALPQRMDALEAHLQSVEARGYRLVTCWDSGMDARLKSIRLPPCLLYLRGRVPDSRLCAIIGTTQPSAWAEDMARAMARRLVERGWAVVSGFAPGIDTAGHQGALQAGGDTVMFLPTGVDHFELRPALAHYAEELGRRAIVASECFPSSPWATAHAMARNRLVAGISDAVIVVEAQRDGGTMSTFRMARRARVPTFALRHSDLPDTAEGNAVALACGARPLASVDDVEQIAALPPRPPRPRQKTLW